MKIDSLNQSIDKSLLETAVKTGISLEEVDKMMELKERFDLHTWLGECACYSGG